MTTLSRSRPRHRVEHIPDPRDTRVNPGIGVIPTDDPNVRPGHISEPDPALGTGPSDAPVAPAIPWQQLLAAQATLDRHYRALADHHRRLLMPAQMETVVLTPAAPTYESREKFEDPVLSIGILNPNSIPIYFSGIGTAGAATRSPSAPPNNLIVLPISAQMIEVAANPSDLGSNNAVCFLLRFFTVQPAFLGKGA